MIQSGFAQVLILLGAAVAIVVACQRLRIPSSLGYLLVGVLLGPHTAGPVVEGESLRLLAEFGIVFLLFTIGLSFSWRQMLALRRLVFGLGTTQVALTVLIVGAIAWLAGASIAAAFVIGAVFAQSSTTVISRQLAEQGEDQTRHGRLAVAVLVFQDVAVAPLLIAIPVLGAGEMGALASSLAVAMLKAGAAFAIVFLVGRWLLRPLFHLVAAHRSAELFTLTVLFVSLLAAWTTHSLGLSMAFGAFLAGMTLAETEFRHQVEIAIRPFRDVLLGLFFVGVGMLIDPAAIARVWSWALAGAASLMLVKAVVTAGAVVRAGLDARTAWRTGLILAVGGEFGFALLAVAINSQVVSPDAAQIALASVLLSIIVAPLLIRFNEQLAARLAPQGPTRETDDAPPSAFESGEHRNHVIICGYGRIGQSVGQFLEEEKIPYAAVELDALKVRQARVVGQPVFYGDAADRDILEALGLSSARLLVVSQGDIDSARRILQHARSIRPDLPIMVRTRDEQHVDELRAAGASEVVPETIEAGMMIASQALLLLNVPVGRVMQRIQRQRELRYPLLRSFVGKEDLYAPSEEAERLKAIVVPGASRVVGRTLAQCGLGDVAVSALVRRGRRELNPSTDTILEAGDALVLLGAPEDLQRAERALLEGAPDAIHNP